MQAPDFFVDPIGFIAYFLGGAGPIVFLAAQLIILLFLYVILTRLIRGSLHAAGMGLEASTGIILAVRLIFFIGALFVVVGYVGPGTATILSLTAVFGTALGLAFSQAMSNIVSGLYVLAARPFRVGDYVKIGSVEGVVREITLNYTQILLPDMTRQLVPNSRAVSSEVTNYRVELSEVIDAPKREEDDGDNSMRESLMSAYEKLLDVAGYDAAYRYTFDLTFHQSLDHKALKRIFEEACEKWASTFVQKPTYTVWSAPSAAVVYRFAYVVTDPMHIIEHNSKFMEDLMSIHWD